MKRKIITVSIKYTRESPVNENYIQYGEAGIYWGEEHIKIHRSNFWFFGLPKKNQLLNTLVHELRHRSSPGLGHNTEFYKLVKKDLSDKKILDYFDLSFKRAGQDVRYSVSSKRANELGWKPQADFDKKLKEIVNFYRDKEIF